MNRALVFVFFIAGGIASLSVAVPVVRRSLANTVFRRRAKVARIGRLRANVNLNQFTSLLGNAHYRRTLSNDVTESVFVDGDYYVQAVSDGDDRVLVYSVTSRSARFRPRVPFVGGGRYSIDQEQPLEVILHETPLAFSDRYSPTTIVASHGMRRFWYSEIYYFGNPGGYQSYVVSINDGAVAEGDVWSVLLDFGEVTGENYAAFLDSPATQSFRASARPNTYSVTAPNVGPFDGSLVSAVLGVDSDVVRTLDA